MTSSDPPPPVADDDFPEFAEPPLHRPDLSRETRVDSAADDAVDSEQDQVDDVIARLRRERDEGKR